VQSQPILANGIDADTGDYVVPPQTPSELSRFICALPPDGHQRREELEARRDALEGEHLGAKEGVDERDLASSGWGVVFSPRLDPAVKEALRPLLEHRQQQASRKREGRYREITHQAGESARRFLAHSGADPESPASPDKMPCYLLLVGGPEDIPFDFQYELDIQYAVGRLAFETVDDYAAYAETVVAVETRTEAARQLSEPGSPEPAASPVAAFFAPKNPGDPTTEQSHDFLVEPLLRWLAEAEDPALSRFRVEAHLGEAATREKLAGLLGEGRRPGEAVPDFLFTASHGLCYKPDDPRQPARQGALVCQEWAGPAARGEATVPDHYFASEDLASETRLDGLIAFHYACCAGGTPHLTAFSRNRTREAAPREFLAALPRRLLAQGALAVIAHVDLNWAYSYLSLSGAESPETFESTLYRLLAGYPVGAAMEYFGQRYLHRACTLYKEREEIRLAGKRVDEEALTRLWTATEDARTYVVLGDPAVRLPTGP